MFQDCHTRSYTSQLIDHPWHVLCFALSVSYISSRLKTWTPPYAINIFFFCFYFSTGPLGKRYYHNRIDVLVLNLFLFLRENKISSSILWFYLVLFSFVLSLKSAWRSTWSGTFCQAELNSDVCGCSVSRTDLEVSNPTVRQKRHYPFPFRFELGGALFELSLLRDLCERS